LAIILSGEWVSTRLGYPLTLLNLTNCIPQELKRLFTVLEGFAAESASHGFHFVRSEGLASLEVTERRHGGLLRRPRLLRTLTEGPYSFPKIGRAWAHAPYSRLYWTGKPSTFFIQIL
jgi:hypothetical protein